MATTTKTKPSKKVIEIPVKRGRGRPLGSKSQQIRVKGLRAALDGIDGGTAVRVLWPEGETLYEAAVSEAVIDQDGRFVLEVRSVPA